MPSMAALKGAVCSVALLPWFPLIFLLGALRRLAVRIDAIQQKARLTLVSATSIVEGGAHDVILKDQNVTSPK